MRPECNTYCVVALMHTEIMYLILSHNVWRKKKLCCLFAPFSPLHTLLLYKTEWNTSINGNHYQMVVAKTPKKKLWCEEIESSILEGLSFSSRHSFWFLLFHHWVRSIIIGVRLNDSELGYSVRICHNIQAFIVPAFFSCQ